ncbi:MAG TPA: alpha/beta hydrolase, partial [Acidimicrobiia bacterium]|nr:alpha/beta hydrolase [Acidimicrobiia bacterium]
PTNVGVVALDLRGRGASHDSPPPFDLSVLADDIVRSLDHFDITRAIVAGYSMGGWIAAICAQSHPDRVGRAVLVDGGFPIADPDADADEVIEAVVGPSLARVDRDFPDRKAFWDYWRAHPALEKHWDDAMRPALEYELVEWNGGFRVRINPEALRVNARQITVDHETRDAGSKLEVPAHLIVVERGTSDQPGGMIPLQTAETAETTMPNLTMEYLSDVNHYTLLLGKGAPIVAATIAPS